jgi:hypothetical protein
MPKNFHTWANNNFASYHGELTFYMSENQSVHSRCQGLMVFRLSKSTLSRIKTSAKSNLYLSIRSQQERKPILHPTTTRWLSSNMSEKQSRKYSQGSASPKIVQKPTFENSTYHNQHAPHAYPLRDLLIEFSYLWLAVLMSLPLCTSLLSCFSSLSC